MHTRRLHRTHRTRRRTSGALLALLSGDAQHLSNTKGIRKTTEQIAQKASTTAASASETTTAAAK